MTFITLGSQINGGGLNKFGDRTLSKIKSNEQGVGDRNKWEGDCKNPWNKNKNAIVNMSTTITIRKLKAV